MGKIKTIFSQGSYTVEATFIMPIIIVVIAALIYMSMYMHDKNRVKVVLDQEIIEGNYTIKYGTGIEDINNQGIFFPLFGNFQDKEKFMKEKVKENLRKGMFLGKAEDIFVEADYNKINIQVLVTMDISMFGTNKDFIVKTTGRVYHPAEFVRKIDGIEGIGENIKGYDKMKEKLQDFLNGG